MRARRLLQAITLALAIAGVFVLSLDSDAKPAMYYYYCGGDCYPPDADGGAGSADADGGVMPDADGGVQPDADGGVQPDADGGVQPDADGGVLSDAASNPDASFSNSVSLDFDGTDDYLTCSTDSDEFECDTEDEMSIAVWAKLDVAAAKPLVLKYGSAQDTFRLETISCVATACKLRTSIQSVCGEGSTVNRLDTTLLPFVEATWNHVVLRFNGAGAANADRLKLYVNNVEYTGAFTGTIPSDLEDCPASVFNFGKVHAAATYWGAGNMDEGMMWCGLLSTTHIAYLYAKNDPWQMTSPPSQWRIWWRIDGDTYGAVDNKATGCSGTCPDLTATGGTSADFESDVP